jgi:hypothetical protein
MSVQVQNGRLFFGKYDWSGDLNGIDLQIGAELQDRTSMIDTARKRVAGLRTVAVQLEGMWSGGAGAVDDAAFSELGVADEPCTVIPTIAAAEGDLAYFFKAIEGSYKPGAKVGELFKFSVSADGTDDTVRGQVMLDGRSTAKTSTGTGPIVNLGALAAGQKLWAAAHVLAVAGTTPSFTLKLQSAALVGFGSPTDRITFSSVNGASSMIANVAGAVTDAYWRFAWTISGTTPSFTVVGVAGIK